MSDLGGRCVDVYNEIVELDAAVTRKARALGEAVKKKGGADRDDVVEVAALKGKREAYTECLRLMRAAGLVRLKMRDRG